MAELPPPVTMITCSSREAIASSTAYWMVGLSSRGRTYLDWALVTGRKRVARPATGKMARRTGGLDIRHSLTRGPSGNPQAETLTRAGRRGRRFGAGPDWAGGG